MASRKPYTGPFPSPWVRRFAFLPIEVASGRMAWFTHYEERILRLGPHGYPVIERRLPGSDVTWTAYED